jgi:hypothetical protein
MKCFGYEDLPEKPNGASIFDSDNVMTLASTLHGLFDKLKLWFEPVVRNLQSLVSRMLNVRRRERKIPTLFVLRKNHIFTRTRQTQSPWSARAQASRCQTLTISGFMQYFVEAPIYLGPVNTWTKFRKAWRICKSCSTMTRLLTPGFLHYGRIVGKLSCLYHGPL